LISKNRSYWNDREIHFLASIAETMPLDTLCHTFNCFASRNNRPQRSVLSIKRKLDLLGYSSKPEIGSFTTVALGRLLGCSHETVRSWCKKGLEHKYRYNTHHGIIDIKINNLKSFARKYPHLFGGFNRTDLFIALEDAKLIDYILENYPKRNSAMRDKQPVRCIETGRIYGSFVEAARNYLITPAGFRSAIIRGSAIAGHHF